MDICEPSRASDPCLADMAAGEQKCLTCPNLPRSVFRDVSAGILSRESSTRQIRTFGKHDQIFREGEKAAHLFCIAEGFVKISQRLESGDQQVVALARRGDLLGLDCLSDEQTYRESVESLCPTKACVISADAFRKTMLDSRDLNDGIIRFSRNQLNQTRETVCRVSRNNLRNKVADVLLTLLDFFGEPHDEGIIIKPWLSREDMAAMAGTVKESFIRQLKEFKEEGIIRTVKRNILVLKTDSLEEIRIRDRLIY